MRPALMTPGWRKALRIIARCGLTAASSEVVLGSRCGGPSGLVHRARHAVSGVTWWHVRRANNPRCMWDGRTVVPPRLGDAASSDAALHKWKHQSLPKLARAASTDLVYLSRGCLRVVLCRESGEKFSRFIREDDSGVHKRKSARAVDQLQTSEDQYLSFSIKVGREAHREREG